MPEPEGVIHMLLKFCARKNQLVNARPGVVLPIGQPVPRINRTLDSKGRYPADPTPFECDSESECGRNALAAMRAGRKDPPLWPADEQTARACGVAFVPIEHVAGEWVEKSAAAPKPSKQTKPGE